MADNQASVQAEDQSPVSVQEFAKRVKEKYPDYKDVDDLTLATKMVEKYPEYKDRVQFDQQPIPPGPITETQPVVPERQTSYIPEVVAGGKALVGSIPSTNKELSINTPNTPKISDSYQAPKPTVIPQGTGDQFKAIDQAQLEKEVGGAQIVQESKPTIQPTESQKQWAENNPNLNAIFSMPGMGVFKDAYIGTKKAIGGLGTTLDVIASNISNNITGGMQTDESGNITAPWEKGYKQDKSEFYQNVRKFEEETPVSSGGATAFIGQLLPQTAALAATVLLRSPSASKAYLASMYGSAFGNGVETYDDYIKETGKQEDPMDRYLVGMGYGAAEYIGEKIGLDYFLPKGYGKLVSKSLDASPQMAKEIGRSVLENYAKLTKQPFSSVIKKVAIGSQVEGGQEVATELMDIAIDKWLTGKDVSGQEIRDRLVESYGGGALMGAGIAPFASVSQNAATSQRRKDQGTVTISIDEEGLPVEIIETEDKVFGIRPDGEEVKNISEATLNKAATFKTDVFENAIKEFSKTNKITTATIEGKQYTIKNPEDLGIEGKPIFATDETGKVQAFPNHKATDPVTQTQGEIDQAQQTAVDQQALRNGILDPNAQIINEENYEDEGTRVVDFSNGQSKIIYNGQEVIANDINEKDAILNSINDFQKLPEPKVTEVGEVIEPAPVDNTEQLFSESKSFSSQIPKRNEGKREVTDYESVSPQITAGALQEKFSDVAVIENIVSEKISDLQGKVSKIGKVKVISDIDQYEQNLNEAKVKTEAITKQLDYWKSVQSELNTQKENKLKVDIEQKQAETDNLLNIVEEYNATPQSREDKQKASEIQAIAKSLGYQTERNAMNQIRLFDQSGTISRPNVSKNVNIENQNTENVPDITEQLLNNEQNANSQTENNSQNIQLQNEESENVDERSSYGNMAADYLLTGGSGVILSSDYFIQALSGVFTHAGSKIDAIRKKYFKEFTSPEFGDVKNFVGTDLYNKIMTEIQDAVNNSYGNNTEIRDIFNQISKHPSGLPYKLGQQINIRIDELNALNNEKPDMQTPESMPESGTNQRENTPQAEQGQGVSEGLEENVNELAPPPSDKIIDENGKMVDYEPNKSTLTGNKGVSIKLTNEISESEPVARFEITTPDSKGHASIFVKNDNTAYIADIQIGDFTDSSRGKGYGLEAYIQIGNKLKELGYTLESTQWDKHFSAISPQAISVWEKLVKQGYAKITGKEQGKIYNRETGEEQVADINTYEFINNQPISTDQPVVESLVADPANDINVTTKKQKQKSNSITGKAKEIEVSQTDPKDLALKYFVDGGLVTSDDVLKQFKGDNGERLARMSYTSNENGLSIAQIAHNIEESLPESVREGLGAMDVFNAVEDVISTHNSPIGMAKTLLSKYSIDENQGYSKEWLDQQLLNEESERLAELELWSNYYKSGQLPTENELIELFNTEENEQEIDNGRIIESNGPVNPEGNVENREVLQGSEPSVSEQIESKDGSKISEPNSDYPRTNKKDNNDEVNQPKRHYKTKGGETLQYSLFSDVDNRTATTSVQRKDNSSNPSLRTLKDGEFSSVEQKYSLDKNFIFDGRNKIESTDDVAFLFKSLENKGIENMFACFVKDGKPTIVHISMGNTAGTIMNFNVLSDGISRFSPDKVYLIHNHPSGNLQYSDADIRVHRQAIDAYGDVIGEHIIINLKTGKYATFREGKQSHEILNRPLSESVNSEKSYKVYNFDKQVFKNDVEFNFGKISQSSDIASFISAQRFSEGNKLSAIILDRGNNIKAYIHLSDVDFQSIKSIEILKTELQGYVGRFSGSSVILSGTRNIGYEELKGVRSVREYLENSNIQLLDIVSNFESKWRYTSMADEGLFEPNDLYKSTPLPEEKQSDVRFRVDEPLSFVITGKNGKTEFTGNESEKKLPNNVKRFKSNTGSVRYVKYVGDNPVSGIQIMTKGDVSVIANIYTIPSERRKGYAKELALLAKSDYPNLKHSTMLEEDGKKFADDVRFRTEEQSKIVRDALSFDNVDDFIDSYKDADFRDSHSAPGNSMSEMTIEERMDQGDDFNLTEVVQGFSVQPKDYFDPRNGARWYGYDDKEGMQSYFAIRSVMSDVNNQIQKNGKITKMPKIKAYRAVPKDVDVNKLIDGDWVTFSKEYAKGHGENRFGEGEYKIISQSVPANQVWWDGNDINEWGYDTGETESLGRSDLKAIWENAHSSVKFRILGETGAANLDKAEEATTRLDNLAVAREMETSGKDAKTIFLATGWEKGADGKWRYETPDNIEFKNIGASKLGQVLGQDHELFKSYPKLRYIEMGVLGVDPYENAEGSFHRKGVNGRATIYAIAPTEEELKSVLIHEIQHAIQDIEGFAKGGNTNMFSKSRELTSKLFKDITSLFDDLGYEKWLLSNDRKTAMSILGRKGNFAGMYAFAETKSEPTKSKMIEKLNQANEVINENDQIFGKHGRYSDLKDQELYRRLAGEVESRNVQSRMNMTPEERRNTLLQETEDVAREDQIVLMEGLGVSNFQEPVVGENINVSEKASSDLSSRPNVVKSLIKISEELGEPVNIINSSEIPEKVGELKKQITSGNRVPAFFYNGKIYLLSDQITSVSDALKSYLHELIVHKGLRDVFAGADKASIIGKQYAKFNDLMSDVFASMSRSQKIDIASKYAPGLYNKNGKIMHNPTIEEKALIGEEFLAHVSENQEIYDEPTLTRWQLFINRLGQIIRKAFRLTSNQFSQKDLLDIVRESRARIKSKSSAGKSSQEGMPLFRATEEMPNTIIIDGRERPTLNSNGKPIANSEEGIRNFWKWFSGKPDSDFTNTQNDLLTASLFESEVKLADSIVRSLKSHSGNLSYFRQSRAVVDHILNNIGVSEKDMIFRKVFSIINKQPEIVDSVIKLIPIDVVNNLSGQKLSSDMILHDQSMLQDLLSVNRNSTIPFASDIANSIIRGVAFSTTEPTSSLGFWTSDGNTTDLAVESNLIPSTNSTTKELFAAVYPVVVDLKNDTAPRTLDSNHIGVFNYISKIGVLGIKNKLTKDEVINNIDKNTSKVVDSEGRPLVVYHGTNKDFDSFKSATGNTGSFSPESNDIRFQIVKDEALNQLKEDLDKITSLGRYSGELKELEKTKVGKKVAERKVIIKQISGYKQGYKAGVAEKRLTLQVIKRNITKYANENMNYDDATRFEITQLLTALNNANTPATITRAFDKIDELASRGLKRKLISRISKTLKAASSKIQSGKPIGRLQPESYKAIDSIKQLMGMTPEEYDNYLDSIPDNDVESMALASMFGNLKEKSVSETFEALTALNSIIFDGRAWYKEKVESLKTKHKELIEKAVSDITGGKGIQSTQDIRSEKGVIDKNSYFKEYLGKNQSFEWLLDLISNNKNDRTGWGFMQDHFGDLANKSENLESKGLRDSIELVNKKAFEIFGKEKSKLAKIFGENSRVVKKSGVTYISKTGARKEIPLSQNEGYKRWMEMNDPSLATTFEKMGWDSQSLDELESFLDPKVLAWAKWQINEFFPEYYKRVNEVYKKMYYVDLPFNPSYSGFLKREKTSVGDNEDTLLRPDTLIQSVSNSSLKSRIKNVRDIVLQDGDQALAKHIAEMEHFMAWAETIREIRAVLSSDSVQDAIKKEHGNNIRTVLNERINSLVRGGVDRGEVNYLVDWIRKNYVTSALGVNLSLTPKQMTAMFSYLNDISIMDYIKGAAEFMANPAQAIEILSQSEFIQRRYKKGWTHEIEAAMKKNNPNTMAGTKSTINSIRDALMLPVMLGDKLAVYSGYPVYAKFYKQYKVDNPTASEQEASDFAINKFERVTKRTQQSSDVSDTSRFQETSFGKVFMMFKNAQQQYFRYEMAAINNLIKGKGNSAENAKIIIITHIVLPVIFQMVANWFTDEDDDKENKRLLRAALLGPIDGLMIAGDIICFGLEKIMGEKWSYSASPMLDVTQDLGNSIQQIIKYINEPYPENEAEDLQKALDFAIQFTSSTMTGIPYEPAKKLYKKATGEEGKVSIQEDASEIISEAEKYLKYVRESAKRKDVELYKKLTGDKESLKAATYLNNYNLRITRLKKAIKFYTQSGDDAKVTELQKKLEETYQEIISKYSDVDFPNRYKLSK